MFTKQLKTDFDMVRKVEWMRYVIGHDALQTPRISVNEFKDDGKGAYIKLTNEGELTLDGDMFDDVDCFTCFDNLSATYDAVMRTASWMLDKGERDPELRPVPGRAIHGYYTRIPHTHVRDRSYGYTPKAPINSTVLLVDPECAFKTLARDGWHVKQKVSYALESGQYRMTFTRENPKSMAVVFIDVERHLLAYLDGWTRDVLYAFTSK